jgi:serine protease
MRRTLALFIAVFTAVSVFGGSARYFVAVQHSAHSAPLAMLRDSGEVRSHAVRAFESVDAFAADLTPDEVAALKRSSEVRYVTPVVERHAFAGGQLQPETTASPYIGSQTVPYGVTMVRARELWRLTKGAGAVNVAILDTGVDTQHSDLAPNIAGGYNTFTGSNDPTDDNGHGTHVAGIVAALDNGIGVVGVAPEARIWSVKVLDSHGFGADENIVAGIDWVMARKHEIGGDWIMSLSLGSPQLSYVERDAFKKVIDDGIVVVAAAGNHASEDVQYPARYPGVIAVGAVDSTGKLAAFSDHGPLLTIVAPGVQVLSTAIHGSVPAAAVSVSGTLIAASAIEGSSKGEIVGTYVICGLGRVEDFPQDTPGNIAVIERGELTFNEKVRNAQAARADGVIIFNRDASDYHSWTLLRPDCSSIAGCDDPTHPWPVVLAVSADDGEKLVSNPQHALDMGAWLDDYKFLSGTSMATPHVSGVLALLWSLDPDAAPSRLRGALLSTTRDLGDPGFDLTYGYGLIDAVRAAMAFAPARFENRVKQPREPSDPAIP